MNDLPDGRSRGKRLARQDRDARSDLRAGLVAPGRSEARYSGNWS